MKKEKSILEEAIDVINERQKQYGSREDNFRVIAGFWSIILGFNVKPKQVAMCMIAMKIAREMWRASRDNAVDIAGYADCLNELTTRSEDDDRYENDSESEL